MSMSDQANIEGSLNDLDGNISTKVTLDDSSYDAMSPKPAQVNLRMTIALAVPVESSSSGESPVTPTLNANARRASETSKVQGYYRVEYSLFPGEPNVGYDIVVFRTAARIYPDNQDSRVVLTWEDAHENVWIVWEHVHTLDLDRDRLEKLFAHKILVKLWDGKEYCSVRTRLDKPRISRSLSNLMSADDANSPRHIVQRIAQNYADKWIARPLLYKLHRPLPIEIPSPSASLQKKIENLGDVRSVTPLNPDGTQMKSVNQPSVEPMANKPDATNDQNQNLPPAIFKLDMDDNEKRPPVKKKRRTGGRANKQYDEKREKGSAQMILPTKPMFAGFKLITHRLDDDVHLPKAIQDCFVSISIEDHSIMKETLAKEFNPLSITIFHVENMPSTPISYNELRERCEPVYCSYQLFDQPVHQTERRHHATDIYWHDLNLYFMNTLDDNCLTQFRNSPFLNIELHDRDERVNSRRRIGSVFGTENSDDSIGRVSGKVDLLKTKNEPEWYPHGCVRLDLSELWLGQTSLEFDVPVVPCHANEPGPGRSKTGKRVSSAKHASIQQGDFLSSDTQMKVLVRLAHPLVRPIENHPLSDQLILAPMTTPPYTRIVFIFSHDNTKFLTSLETYIRTINAKALGFDSHPAHVQIAALSTYKLTEAQETSDILNIITGFHLFDDEQHIFVLEGRKEDAIDILYQKLPKPEGQNVEILYDSSIHFTERLYIKFGPDIIHVKLSRKLRDIVSQPLIFVRDTLAKDTFDALDKLHQLVHAGKLSATARYNLFPTIDMINALHRDFGVPLTEKEIKLFASDDRTPSASTVHDKDEKQLQHEDESHVLDKPIPPSREEMHSTHTNFLQRNVERVHLTSLKNKENRENDDQQVFITIGPIYPYSTQKLNASENALEQMRSYVKEHHRSSSCSFNPNHRSGTFSPYSQEESVLDYHHKLRSPLDFASSPSKEKHLEKNTPEWINHPGPRTSRQSNIHPKTPDPARLEELSKAPEEWYERSTNASSSATPVREPFRWIQRKDDFDRWTRPPPVPTNISAHWDATEKQNSKANSRASSVTGIVVSDERMYFLRKSPQTELIESGRLSATQLDRLTGILKDKPVKKGLLLPKSYSRDNGIQSAPLMRRRSSSRTPDRRAHSRTGTTTITAVSFPTYV